MTASTDDLFLFGYGSLLFKPPLHHLPHLSSQFVRHEGYIENHIRRFWQSSCDNRGTPQYKGRVVTIIPRSDVETLRAQGHDTLVDSYEADGVFRVQGVCFQIPAHLAQEARQYLDLREQDGYTIQRVPFYSQSTNHVFEAIVYVGTLQNPSWIGCEAVHDTAAVIAQAEGESGKNIDYLLDLYACCPEDEYLKALAETVQHMKNA